MRLIDGDALIKIALKNEDHTVDGYDIMDAPTVDAMPVVHGRWIDYKDEHQCSVCKETTIVDFYVWKNIQFDFCPYCGAKMDGEKEEEE